MRKQYRVCCLGDYDSYYSYFLYGVMEGAIRNGYWFRPVPLYNHLLDFIFEQVQWFRPHVLFCHTIFNRRPHNREEVLERLRDLRVNLGVKVVYHAGDARRYPRYPKDISESVDIALLNNSLTDEFSDIWRIPTIHWPYMALHQSDISSPSLIYESEVAFTGYLGDSDHHEPRSKFIAKLREFVPVKIFPTEETGNTRFQTAELSSSAKAVLGFQMGLDIPGYLDVRPWQYIGSGALYFHDRCDSMDLFFRDGEHYVAFDRDNPKDFVDKFEFYTKKKPSLGEKIRKEGFEYCQTFHDTTCRIKSVINVLEGKPYRLWSLESK